jgi:HEAT repeat protein
MPFGFDFSATVMIWAPALGALLSVVLVVAFICVRRVLRARYFRKRDRIVLAIRRDWVRIVTLQIPPQEWLFQPMAREIVEDIAWDQMSSGSAEERQAIARFFRESGLLDHHRALAAAAAGWRRRQSIQALGRMRLPEGLPIAMAALNLKCVATKLDAVRALGQIATAEAGMAIIQRLREKPAIPAVIAEPALLNCFRDNPGGLMEATIGAPDDVRPLLARVLAEVATQASAEGVAALSGDPDPDVRAAAARIAGITKPPGAAGILCVLARDEMWFVRLRAMLAMGQFQDPFIIPVLIEGLCDRNRLVRLRAASALASLDGEEHRIVSLVEHTGDRYALQSLIGSLDRNGKLRMMIDSLAAGPSATIEQSLMAVVRAGSVRIVAEAAMSHADERVRTRLRMMLERSGDASVTEFLRQAGYTFPAEPGIAVADLAKLANALKARTELGHPQ